MHGNAVNAGRQKELIMGNPQITIDGKNYNVFHMFTERRALVDFEGLAVICDRSDDGSWSLSGEPASPEEQLMIEKYMPDDSLTVTKDP